MGGQRRLIGWVLAIALMTAASAGRLEAARWRGGDGEPAACATNLHARAAPPGWLSFAWSWWTALIGADNGQIVP